MPRLRTLDNVCLTHAARVGRIRFEPCDALRFDAELNWHADATQLKLAGTELCLVPTGFAWLRWLVPQRLALAACSVSLRHQWASLDPLCDMRGACFGKIGQRPHPLSVRQRHLTLSARPDGPERWAAFAALAGALLLLMLMVGVCTFTLVHQRARSMAAQYDGLVSPSPAHPHAQFAATPSPSTSVGSSASPPARSSDARESTQQPAHGALASPSVLSPIDEQSVHLSPVISSTRTTPRVAAAGVASGGRASGYRIYKPPRPPAASDTSSSGGSSVVRPDHDENAWPEAHCTAMTPKPPSSARASARPDGGGKQRRGGGGSASSNAPASAGGSTSATAQLMRAVASVADSLISPARQATRTAYGLPPLPLSASKANSAARAAAAAGACTPAKAAPEEAEDDEAEQALSDSSSDSEEGTSSASRASAGSTDATQAYVGRGLKGKLQEQLLERSHRMHRPLESGKTRCAACLNKIKLLSVASPRVTFVACARDCGRVWHPKCLPKGDARRVRSFVCAECAAR